MRSLKSLILAIILLLAFGTDTNAQCTTDGHSNVWNDGWISCQTSPSPNSARGTGHWIAYEFDVAYSLGTMDFWNSNETGQTNRGIRDVIIDYSLDGVNWIEWGVHQFPEAPGTNDYQGVPGPDLANVLAKHVLITIVNTWGDANCAGIAEVRFNLTPTVRADLDFFVFLEGPYNPNTGTMNTLPAALIPIQQPYSGAPYNYAGGEYISNIPTGMVDWVLVEARRGTPSQTGSAGTVPTQIKAGILMDNGQILDIDGSLITFDLVQNESYHFLIRHRNHLDIISNEAFTGQLLISNDFGASINEAFGPQQLKMASDGKAVMYAGDFNQDGQVQTTDYDKWKYAPAQLNTYSNTDANLDGTIQVTDYDRWYNNRAKNGIIEISF